MVLSNYRQVDYNPPGGTRLLREASKWVAILKIATVDLV